MSSTDFNIQNSVTTTFQTIQSQNINSALFGGMVIWGLFVFIGAIDLWSKKRDKPMFVLNMIQAGLNLFKITSAMSFIVFFDLDCSARAFLLNIPQAIAWVLIYNMLLIKLLLFTPYKLFSKLFFAASLISYFVLVCIGVGQSQQTYNAGKCGNRYPIVFKQQYTVEMIIEIFTFLMLAQALAYKKNGTFAGTGEIFKQLRDNENLRIFLVIPITAFDALALTHGIDSARSASVHWVLAREQRKIYEAATRARKASLPYNSAEKSGDNSRRPSAQYQSQSSHSRRPSQPTQNIMSSLGSQNALTKSANPRVSVVYEDCVVDMAPTSHAKSVPSVPQDQSFVVGPGNQSTVKISRSQSQTEHVTSIVIQECSSHVGKILRTTSLSDQDAQVMQENTSQENQLIM